MWARSLSRGGDVPGGRRSGQARLRWVSPTPSASHHEYFYPTVGCLAGWQLSWVDEGGEPRRVLASVQMPGFSRDSPLAPPEARVGRRGRLPHAWDKPSRGCSLSTVANAVFLKLSQA